MIPNPFDKIESVIVQGITGSHGAFHTRAMVADGTNIVAGTSPNKAGQILDGIPVYKSIADIQKDFPVDASVIFVPAPFAKNAIIEAIDAEVPLIVCITEGIPVHDMLVVHTRLQRSKSVLVGPNCPGILLPGRAKLGIIPAHMGLPGSIGVVSRSGTLTYEAIASLTEHGVGQRYVIGIGGDPVRGTNFVECLRLIEEDPAVSHIVMIGEIGGSMEAEAARWIKENGTKPVVGFIAGQTAPPGRRMGHAGAIVGGADDTAAAKMKIMAECGIHVVESPANIGKTIAEVLKKK